MYGSGFPVQVVLFVDPLGGRHRGPCFSEHKFLTQQRARERKRERHGEIEPHTHS